jgi:hypothetical protein
VADGPSEAHLPEPDDEVLVAFEDGGTSAQAPAPGQSAGLRSDGELVQDEDDDLSHLTSEQDTDEAKPGDVVIEGKKILLNAPDRDPSEDMLGQGPSGDAGLLGQSNETDLGFVSEPATDGGETQEPPTEEVSFVFHNITWTDDGSADLTSGEQGEPGMPAADHTLFKPDGTPLRAAGEDAQGAEPADMGTPSEDEAGPGGVVEGGNNEFVHKPPGKGGPSGAEDSLANPDEAPSDDGVTLRQFQEVSGDDSGPDLASGEPDQASR